MILQQARTRATLAALGISLWGSRDQLPQPVPVVSLWGRLSESNFLESSILEGNLSESKHPESPDNDQLEQTRHDQNRVINDASKNASSTHVEFPRVSTLPDQTVVHSLAVPELSSASSKKLKTEVQQSEKSSRLPFAQTITTSEPVHVEQVIRFSLEARVIGEWVVLVSVQALNHPDRRALWKNISQALMNKSYSQEVYRFDWPLAEGGRWQHNTGAQAALMGFLTRFGLEHRIGLMGELPDLIVPDRLERLPSLDELLGEPLKKRSLWRLLSGSVR